VEFSKYTLPGIYIVKPDAFHERTQIRLELDKISKNIFNLELTLNKEDVLNLYSDPIIQQSIPYVVNYMLSGLCELNVVLLESYDSFTNLIGVKTVPKKCMSSSLRYQFGKDSEKIGDIYLVRNGIHRTKDQNEFLKDFLVFRKYIELFNNHNQYIEDLLNS